MFTDEKLFKENSEVLNDIPTEAADDTFTDKFSSPTDDVEKSNIDGKQNTGLSYYINFSK